MKANPIGLYVHLPFCKRKCNYCDFCSYTDISSEVRRKYIERLKAEIYEYSKKGISADTVFFGGGTPSLLTPSEIGEILSALRDSFDISPCAEFTLEANPGTVTEESLRGYFEAGINRLSFGLQSIHENELKILGRIHSFEDFLSSYEAARRVGCNNISIDLMYGLPEQTVSSFEETLRAVISLAPEHISVYGLILEEGTPLFAKQKELALPSEDDECDMYELAAKLLCDVGYSHYEISNYARCSFECKHNLKYWRAEEYLGFGVAAHSYFEGARIYNPDSIEAYLSGEEHLVSELPSREEYAFEYAMLRLRLKEGLSLGEYEELFGAPFRYGREAKLCELSKLGLIKMDKDRLSLTDQGFYVSNSILSELL
ncbi:MAG: radical SAM family heme chaperone HemW [Clostridia bacterium]|nr:radical SAM family heme chaperone HemW [Clostridia bacterium]